MKDSYIDNSPAIFLRETQIDDFYDYYEPHCVSYFCQEIFPNDIDSNYLDEHFCIIQKLNLEYFSKTKNLIEEKRQWINYEKLHKKAAEKLAEIIERKRYAKRISKTLIRPSTLIGLRKYSIEEHNQTYNELNDFLKSMYDSYLTSDKKDVRTEQTVFPLKSRNTPAMTRCAIGYD